MKKIAKKAVRSATSSNLNHLIFLSLVGEDKPGIISQITGVLYKAGCNVEDASMTLLDGKFSMMIAFRTNPKSLARLKTAMNCIEKEMKLSSFFKVFATQSELSSSIREANCFISAIGPDQTGIVHKISRILAAKKLNITDLNCKLLPGYSRNIYSLVLETYIETAQTLAATKHLLQILARQLKIEIQIKPVQILNL